MYSHLYNTTRYTYIDTFIEIYVHEFKLGKYRKKVVVMKSTPENSYMYVLCTCAGLEPTYSFIHTHPCTNPHSSILSQSSGKTMIRKD